MIGTGTKKAPKAKPRRSILIEALTRSKPERVDRVAGVIYGVKIIGLESENDRRYTSAALNKARPLYENLVVNIDHPSKPSESRSAQDRLGKLVNVRLTEDGLYADLHILKSHPMAERLLEAAETMPDLFGMSHNAQGMGSQEGNVFVVEEITEVRSCDLVADPATTKSLFESKRRTVKTTLRKLLESWKPKKAPVKKGLKALLEEDVPLDMEMDAPADDAGAEDDGMGGLTDAISGIVKSGNHDLAMKVLKLIQKESEPAPEPEVSEGDDEEGDEKEDGEKDMEEADDEDEKEKDTKESRQPKKVVAKTLNWERAHDLCEEHKISPDKALVKTLCKLNEEEAKGLLKREQKLMESKTHSTWNDLPRSQGRGSNGTNDKLPTDGKSFAAAIRR